MVEEHVRGLTRRYRDVTLTYALWMETGEHGRLGADALLLAEEGSRPARVCALIQLPPTVDDLVQETLYSFPGVTYKPVQVGLHMPEEVLLEILMMLNLELLS